MADKSPASADNALQRFRDPQFRELYANQAFVSMSPFDISMTFSKLAEITPAQQGFLDQVNITVSPQQLKSILRVLTNTLEAYEEHFGRLYIPDEEIEPQFSKEDLSKLISESRKKSKEVKNRARAHLKR
jgi:Protein of unknown function (DUF3467)